MNCSRCDDKMLKGEIGHNKTGYKKFYWCLPCGQEGRPNIHYVGEEKENG